jgi:hypothetical protein
LIENPLLCSVSSDQIILCNIVAIGLQNSPHWHSRYYEERFINFETKPGIHSLGLLSFHFVNIDNVPLLLGTAALGPNSDGLSLGILASSNLNDLLALNALNVLVTDKLE